MYMVVFGGIAKIPTDGLPQPMFYLAGIVCWQYFADCLNKTSNTFTVNQGIFGKVYFPRLIVPMSVIASNLMRMGIQLLLFIVVYIYYLIIGVQVAPNVYVLLLPLLVIMLAGLSLGFGIIISSMTTKYREPDHLVFLYSSTLDVCYAYYLSLKHHVARKTMDHGHQSCNFHCGNIQIRNHGRRYVQLGHVGI